MAAVELSQALRQELDWPHFVAHHPKSGRFGASGEFNTKQSMKLRNNPALDVN